MSESECGCVALPMCPGHNTLVSCRGLRIRLGRNEAFCNVARSLSPSNTATTSVVGAPLSNTATTSVVGAGVTDDGQAEGGDEEGGETSRAGAWGAGCFGVSVGTFAVRASSCCDMTTLLLVLLVLMLVLLVFAVFTKCGRPGYKQNSWTLK